MVGHYFTYLHSLLLLLQLTIQPEDLLPQLPNPKDLQPFPTVMSMVYEGHTDMVRSIACEPKGQYMVSGSDDLTIKGKISVVYFSVTDKILARRHYLQNFTLLATFI
jgi:WD40 repeat protein